VGTLPRLLERDGERQSLVLDSRQSSGLCRVTRISTFAARVQRLHVEDINAFHFS
jgi:hypothetical protein